ncbi:N-methylhydantoinase B [Stella humosa]|uniref:N-methylhydantoinase B n=1 Tax=Stella humosa TaxID=94 RepID=A0A3N1KUY0_9PROT|nr:hydantoinase B/oxoprolinase family protein [Stella humosa]ROP83784.1 N-methylhydantoinase B [Stella humosa]BBK32955.1 methylhydantoinase [Stella humosa]
MKLDPIDYAVISQSLQAAAREMGVKLIRSAYSTILREARDGSAALLDRDGNVVAQAELIPMQLGPIGATIKPCLELHPADTLSEGDFFINNDPYAGGQHLQDVFIFTPIFVEGEVVGFSASVAHHLDVGGGSAGLTAEATDVIAEGLRIPPSCWNMDKDWNGGRLERLVAHNIRVPDQTIGDFNAQFAANAMGAARVRQLCEKYGVAAFKETMRELLDYSERRVRAAIAKVPDGTYTGEAVLDDDGIGFEAIPIRCRLTISGESVSIDFEGSAPQVGRNINCPFSSTISAALSAVKSVLTSPDIPFNEGLKRPISVTAPYGSIVNPKPPAPVRARMLSAYRAYDAVMMALSQAVPELVPALGFNTTTVTCLAHMGENGYAVHLEPMGGGYGGSRAVDGCDGVDNGLSNCANTPVEALDSGYDFFRIHSYELATDSFGHGAHRGGAGFFRRYEILKDGVTFSMYADHFSHPAAGLAGGSPGMLGHARILRGDETIKLRSKSANPVRKGDIVEVLLGGGGGYGHPEMRDPRDVERDVADGLLGVEAARRYRRAEAAE